jgi:hypothetical protein
LVIPNITLVIPNEVRDLQFASLANTGKLQIPHFVRDDKAGVMIRG